MHKTSMSQLYTCEKCGKVAKTKQALERHAAYHEDERPYSCDVCLQRFKNTDDRGKHYRRLRRDGKFSYACQICHKHFKSSELLARHHAMLGCSNKPIQNVDMSKKDRNQNDSRGSCSPHMSKNGSEFISDSLDNRSGNCQKVWLGNELKKKVNVLRCVCKICQSPFDSAAALKTHYMGFHQDKKKQVCLQCGVSLSSKDSLARHYSIFHQEESPYQCRICAQTFKIKEGLCRHEKLVHKVVLETQCLPCPNKAGLKPTDKRQSEDLRLEQGSKKLPRKKSYNKHVAIPERVNDAAQGEVIEDLTLTNLTCELTDIGCSLVKANEDSTLNYDMSKVRSDLAEVKIDLTRDVGEDHAGNYVKSLTSGVGNGSDVDTKATGLLSAARTGGDEDECQGIVSGDDDYEAATDTEECGTSTFKDATHANNCAASFGKKLDDCNKVTSFVGNNLGDGKNVTNFGKHLSDDNNVTNLGKHLSDGKNVTHLDEHLSDNNNVTNFHKHLSDGNNVINLGKHLSDDNNVTNFHKPLSDGNNVTNFGNNLSDDNKLGDRQENNGNETRGQASSFKEKSVKIGAQSTGSVEKTILPDSCRVNNSAETSSNVYDEKSESQSIMSVESVKNKHIGKHSRKRLNDVQSIAQAGSVAKFIEHAHNKCCVDKNARGINCEMKFVAQPVNSMDVSCINDVISADGEPQGSYHNQLLKSSKQRDITKTEPVSVNRTSCGAKNVISADSEPQGSYHNQLLKSSKQRDITKTKPVSVNRTSCGTKNVTKESNVLSQGWGRGSRFRHTGLSTLFTSCPRSAGLDVHQNIEQPSGYEQRPCRVSLKELLTNDESIREKAEDNDFNVCKERDDELVQRCCGKALDLQTLYGSESRLMGAEENREVKSAQSKRKGIYQGCERGKDLVSLKKHRYGNFQQEQQGELELNVESQKSEMLNSSTVETEKTHDPPLMKIHSRGMWRDNNRCNSDTGNLFSVTGHNLDTEQCAHLDSSRRRAGCSSDWFREEKESYTDTSDHCLNKIHSKNVSCMSQSVSYESYSKWKYIITTKEACVSNSSHFLSTRASMNQNKSSLSSEPLPTNASYTSAMLIADNEGDKIVNADETGDNGNNGNYDSDNNIDIDGQSSPAPKGATLQKHSTSMTSSSSFSTSNNLNWNQTSATVASFQDTVRSLSPLSVTSKPLIVNTGINNSTETSETPCGGEAKPFQDKNSSKSETRVKTPPSPLSASLSKGKFSLVKYMLMLQNEDLFDKSLFNKTLESPESEARDFQGMVARHRISESPGVAVYDLSMKQSIPFHWLGLTVKKDLQQNEKDTYSESGETPVQPALEEKERCLSSNSDQSDHFPTEGCTKPLTSTTSEKMSNDIFWEKASNAAVLQKIQGIEHPTIIVETYRHSARKERSKSRTYVSNFGETMGTSGCEAVSYSINRTQNGVGEKLVNKPTIEEPVRESLVGLHNPERMFRKRHLGSLHLLEACTLSTEDNGTLGPACEDRSTTASSMSQQRDRSAGDEAANSRHMDRKISLGQRVFNKEEQRIASSDTDQVRFSVYQPMNESFEVSNDDVPMFTQNSSSAKHRKMFGENVRAQLNSDEEAVIHYNQTRR